MKFIILFMLVILGHCDDLTGPNCLKKTILAFPEFFDEMLKAMCVIDGVNSEQEMVEAAQKFGGEMEKVSAGVGCTTKEMIGVNSAQLLDSTGKSLQTVGINMGTALEKIGLVKTVMQLMCNVVNGQRNTQCYDNMMQLVKDDLATDSSVVDWIKLKDLLHDPGCMDIQPNALVGRALLEASPRTMIETPDVNIPDSEALKVRNPVVKSLIGLSELLSSLLNIPDNEALKVSKPLVESLTGLSKLLSSLLKNLGVVIDNINSVVGTVADNLGSVAGSTGAGG